MKSTPKLKLTTAEAQSTQSCEEKKNQLFFAIPLRFLRALCASAVRELISALTANPSAQTSSHSLRI